MSGAVIFLGVITLQYHDALVLSGGGARGAYQIGIIETLLEHDIRPSLVAGSSIGAFNGGLLAEALLQDDDILATFQDISHQAWDELSEIIKFNFHGFCRTFPNIKNISSILDPSILCNVLRSNFPVDRVLSDYKDCHLFVTATNLTEKKSLIFDNMANIQVRKAILASMTFPAAFPAMKMGDDFYIDGGALNNTPLKEVILQGAKRIFVVILRPPEVFETAKEYSLGDIYEQTLPAYQVLLDFYDMATAHLMYGDLKKAEKINKLIKIINKYYDSLDSEFLEELKNLFGLENYRKKKVIKIIKIYPKKELDPPGTVGFADQEAIRNLIGKGKEDCRKVLKEIK